MRGHPHPPLNAWILAGLLAMFGDVYEVPFHAAYIVFSLIAAIGMWSLARRFTDWPLGATLLFLAVAGVRDQRQLARVRSSVSRVLDGGVCAVRLGPVHLGCASAGAGRDDAPTRLWSRRRSSRSTAGCMRGVPAEAWVVTFTPVLSSRLPSL